MTVTQPRLSPCQLPCVGKCVSNSGCTPIRAIWASNNGISSTRSLKMVKVSFIPRPYHNVQNPFKFERTVSRMVENPITIAALVLVIATIFVVIITIAFFEYNRDFLQGILTEAHGMLFDIL